MPTSQEEGGDILRTFEWGRAKEPICRGWMGIRKGEGQVAFLGYWATARPAPQHHEYAVYVSLIIKYTLGINVLQELWLQTTVGKSSICRGMLSMPQLSCCPYKG